MNIWMSETVVRGVGWTLVHFLWEGLAIEGLLAVALRLMRRSPAHWRYLAASAAMALMAVAPLVTFQLVLDRDEPPVVVSVAVNDFQPAAGEPAISSPATAEPSIVTAPEPVPREQLRAADKTDGTDGTVKSPVGDDVRSLKYFRLFSHKLETPYVVSYFSDGLLAQRIEAWMPWLVMAWLAGVCLLSCRLLAGWWQVRRLKGKATESPGEIWEQKLVELARRLGVNRSIRLLQSALVEVPTVIGWLRPVILLPVSCLTGLTPQQLEAILAHELAHIRRHDYLINLLQSAVETLLFYHPAVWWVSRKMREERENCCDDLAVAVNGDRVGYARALATLEELRPAPAQLMLAAGGAPLLRRIQRLAGRSNRESSARSWPAVGILALLLLALAALGVREHRASAAEATAGQVTTETALTVAQSNVVAAPNDEPQPELGRMVQIVKPSLDAPRSSWRTNVQYAAADTPPPAERATASGEPGGETGQSSVPATSDESPSLQTRTFRVDPARLLNALGANLGTNLGNVSVAKVTVGSGGGIGGIGLAGGAASPAHVSGSGGSIPFVTVPHEAPAHEAVENAIRDYFKGSGIDLSTNHGRVVIYDVRGELTVRATQSELETISLAVNSLNEVLPQVNIKTRFIEITQNDTRAFGFQWITGGVVAGASGGTVLNGGSAPQLTGAPSAEHPLGFFPGTPNGPPGSTNLTNGLRNSQNAPAIATVTGILTDPQYRTVIQALEQRDGTQVLTAPEVTTESGRQAQMKAVEIQTIVTGAPTNAGGLYSTSNMSFGPEIDVVPYVDGSRSNITLAIMPSITEFLGYDNPGQFMPTGGRATNAVLPLPRFRVRQTTTTVTVGDGQTVCIGGFMTTEVVTTKSKTPVLGSIPLLGRAFQSTQTVNNRKNLMIFVTATIVNPDGTRYHPEEHHAPSAPTSDIQPTTDSGSQAQMQAVDIQQIVTRSAPGLEGSPVAVATSVQIGRSLYEAGRYDEAEVYFQKALALEPHNVPAEHYLELIEAKRALLQGGNADSRARENGSNQLASASIPGAPANPFARLGPQVNTSPGRKLIFDKLNRITIDHLDFGDVTLKQALDDLEARARAAEPDDPVINFFFIRQEYPNIADAQGGPIIPNAPEPGVASVHLHLLLDHVTMAQALDAIVQSAQSPLRFSVLDYGILFSLRTNASPSLEIRSFKPDPARAREIVPDVAVGRATSPGPGIGGAAVNYITVTGQRPFTNAAANGPTPGGKVEQEVREYFAALGIDLSTNSNKAVIWNDRKGILTVRASPDDLDLIEKALATSSPGGGSLEPGGVTVEKVAVASFAPQNAAVSQRTAIIDQLNRIRLDVNYADTPLPAVLDDLHRLIQAKDVDGQGVNFICNNFDPDVRTNLLTRPEPTVRLNLQNATVTQILAAIGDACSTPVIYQVMDYGVVFSPRLASEPAPFQIRAFAIKGSPFLAALQASTGTDLSTNADGVPAAVRKYFAARGLDLDASAGKAVIYNGQTGWLIIRAAPSDLDAVERDFRRANGTGPTGAAAPSGLPTGTISSPQSPGRKLIFDKLNRIPIESLSYTDLPLKDVLDDLSAKARARDPDGTGINFFFSHDPSSNEPDVGTVKVQFSLKHITLANALDAVVKSSDPPLKFSVLDYGIMFSLRGNEPVPLEIRSFKVDGNTFQDGLSKLGGTDTNSSSVFTNRSSASAVEAQARAFFSAVGLDLSTNSGKDVIWNDRRGILTIKATADDLDLIEKAIQVVSASPPRVKLTVKFAEIPENDTRAFGFQADIRGISAGAGSPNPPGLFPGSTNGPGSTNVVATIVATEGSPAGTNTGQAQLTNAPVVASTTGILTDPQYRTVMQALEQRDGTEILTAPEVTVESGRQARIQSESRQTVSGGGSSATNANAGPDTNTVLFGPELEVVPYITEDGASVQLALTPSVPELVLGQPIPQAAVPTGGTITSVMTLPHFRPRQFMSSATVLDGQTVAVGGLMIPGKTREQIEAELADLNRTNPPLVGHWVRSEATTNAMMAKKNLMVFVTVTLVNPDGTRFHSDDQLEGLRAWPQQ